MLDYLKETGAASYDIHLKVELTTGKDSTPVAISNTNFKYMYYSPKQQLVHHTVTGRYLRNQKKKNFFSKLSIQDVTCNQETSLELERYLDR